MLVLMILCMVLITERSFFEDFRKTGKKVYKNVYENTREDAAIRRERAAIREEKRRIIREEQRKMQREQLEKEKDQLKTLPDTLRRNQKVSGVNLNGLAPRSMPLEEVHEIVPPVPKTRPEVEEPNLKVMDQAIGGKSFQVPPRERFRRPARASLCRSEVPGTGDSGSGGGSDSCFHSRTAASSFEEQLRINGELVSAARNQAEEQAQEPEDGGEFMEATDELYQPLRQPVFLQRPMKQKMPIRKRFSVSAGGHRKTQQPMDWSSTESFRRQRRFRPLERKRRKCRKVMRMPVWKRFLMRKIRRFMRSRKTTWMLMKSQKTPSLSVIQAIWRRS